ncbi:MAG: hypothetical protein L6Q76_01845 [Polyangiaceae bacterium]|nr:hypothetical protein [Polyangiaceae bacterium]
MQARLFGICSSFVARSASRRLTALAAAGATLLLASTQGCLNRPIQPDDPRTTSTITERLTQSRVDKIDLLLAVDNSLSMADKQQILAEAVPDLVEELVNPRCLDPLGNPAASQPQSPQDPCPKGSRREFTPVFDIHIGIISSSLGDYGGGACSFNSPDFDGNDKAHLVHRSPTPEKGDVTTYKNAGFLAWDPLQKLDPKGEMVLESEDGASGLIPALKEMVRGVGQTGCPFEAQLESWYRFLIDPKPYLEVVKDGNLSSPRGVDEILLAQRAEFLRPDSLVAILMLSDENDCSISEQGLAHLATRFKPLPRLRSECAQNPEDACCAPCGEESSSCPADPTCAAPVENESLGLRCFDQKNRYGYDFLYPTDRYVKALTSELIADRDGNLVPNPLFSDLNPADNNSTIRDKSQVFFAGIVGVPWQDIARDPADLTKGFKNSDELAMKDEAGRTAWDIVLGDPKTHTKPLDPFMIESVGPRPAGHNPVTGDPVLPPGSETNAINGHERADNGEELQYACTLPLIEKKDCAGVAGCDCSTVKAGAPNPLCEKDASGNQTTIQTHAKAYPGLRQLDVLKELGPQGIVASVCAAQVNDKSRDDFGYRPAIGALVNQLKTALRGQCLARELEPVDEQVSCLILEARRTGGACSCNAEDARQPVTNEHMPAVTAALADVNAESAGWDCFCEIPQLTGDALTACRTEPDGSPALMSIEKDGGWCYVDAATGNADLVATCPSTERRMIRFLGNGEVQPSATAFITCSVESNKK